MGDETNPDNTQTQTPSDSATEQGANTPDDTKAPAWATGLFERLTVIEGKQTQVGKDQGKLRSKIRKVSGEDVKSEPDGDGSAKQPQGVTPEDARADMLAAMKLGRALESLPEAARDTLQGAVDEGDMSFTDALERAEFLKAHLPATGETTTTTETKAPDGRPASGARSDGQKFGSWDAWIKFQAASPAKAHAHMQSNPDFTPSKLPGGPRHR